MTKIATSIEQSKKLAEILPLESADMWWVALNWQETEYYVEVKQDGINQPKKAVPCWSLAALLDYLKQRYYVRLEHDGISWSITCIEHDTDKKYISSMFDDPIDACWGMILRLNKEEGE